MQRRIHVNGDDKTDKFNAGLDAKLERLIAAPAKGLCASNLNDSFFSVQFPRMGKAPSVNHNFRVVSKRISKHLNK
jgi:hypothetical protein